MQSPACGFHGPPLTLHAPLLVLHHFQNQCVLRSFARSVLISPGLSVVQLLERSFSNKPCPVTASLPRVQSEDPFLGGVHKTLDSWFLLWRAQLGPHLQVHCQGTLGRVPVCPPYSLSW